LHDIGSLMAFDVLLNNWDRIPLIWDNEGNSGNFLFVKNDLQRPLVGIDQSCIAIVNWGPSKKGFDEYMTKVRALLQELEQYQTSNTTDIGPILRRVISYINTSIGSTLVENRELVYIVSGIVDGILALIGNITIKLLGDTWQKLSNEVNAFISKKGSGDTELYYGLAFVITSFLEEILGIFTKHKPSLKPATIPHT